MAKSIPRGIPYTVCAGTGAARALLIGIVFFNVAAGHMRMTVAGLIILGIALMKSSSST